MSKMRHHEALPRPHAAMKDYRECVRMKLIQYQALLGNPRNVASVRARIRDVEHVGGHVEIAPPTRVGMVLVMIELPEGYIPEQFFPNIPFYPI
jgi:hypothetical protein